ncbi:MAG: VWA domain-containing protein [bacterium]|nr:VWA domain-containing protein [bacterium]
MVILEQTRTLKPDHLKRVQTALKELYVGEDFGKLSRFYEKLFHIAADSPQASEDVVTRPAMTKFGGNRDYILRYRLAGEDIQSGLLLYEGSGSNVDGTFDGENFFLLMLEPPARVISKHIPPREYIFIVDVSGSMEGFPLNTSKQLLRKLISELRPTDTFNVLLFAGSSNVMSEESVPANRSNIDRAIGLIENKQGGGGTELLPALKRALALPKDEGTARTIVIATDGLVNGESEAFELIRHNRHNANIFAFGIGSSVNRFLIEGMARAGSGEPFVVTSPDKADGQAEKFRRYVQSPVLTGIECDFGEFEVYDVEPLSVPDVLAERPVLLFGKWRGKTQGTITLNGFSGEGLYQQRFDLSNVEPKDANSTLRYLWARKRIETLRHGEGADSDEERKHAITSLGLTYNLLTAHTSFVAIDEKVRREKGTLKSVKQPQPAPKGVSINAVGGGAAAVSTPEPTTIILVGLGLIGIMALGRRRKR